MGELLLILNTCLLFAGLVMTNVLYLIHTMSHKYSVQCTHRWWHHALKEIRKGLEVYANDNYTKDKKHTWQRMWTECYENSTLLTNNIKYTAAVQSDHVRGRERVLWPHKYERARAKVSQQPSVDHTQNISTTLLHGVCTDIVRINPLFLGFKLLSF